MIKYDFFNILQIKAKEILEGNCGKLTPSAPTQLPLSRQPALSQTDSYLYFASALAEGKSK